MAKCNCCGRIINATVTICPGCGSKIVGIDGDGPSENYYSILGISPQASCSEIATRLKDKGRFWARQANSASLLEERHKAERMLEELAKADSILLNPLKRKEYDELLRKSQRNRTDTPYSPAAKNRESYKASSSSCPRCGLRQTALSPFCPACGYKFTDFPTDDKVTTPYYTKPRVPYNAESNYSDYRGDENNSETRKNILSQGFAFCGWQKLKGIIIMVEPPYMAPYRDGMIFSIVKISLGIMLLPFLLSIVLAVAMMGMLFSFMGSGRPGFFSSFASQMVSFFFTRSLIKPKEQTFVRDARLRDELDQEHLIRIRGELISGNINVGDEIEVEGFNSGGTLLVRRGFNLRTRSEIRIRKR